LVWFEFVALNLTYFVICMFIPGSMVPHRYFSSCVQILYCGGVYCSSAQKVWWEL